MATETENTPDQSISAKGADVASIAADLAGTMPDVQEHAVQQAERERQEQHADPRDKAGAAFDPAVHVTGADGRGILTVRGTWEKKRGRKGAATPPVTPGQKVTGNTGSVLGGPAARTPQQTTEQIQKAQQDVQSRAAGVAAAEMLFVAGQVIGGEEWAPMQNKAIGLDERAMMHQAFGDYFVATNRSDIPPGAALAFCVIAYAAPRFAMPKTQSRFAKIKGAIVTWWVNRKLRKIGAGVQVEPKRPEGQTTEKQ